MSRYGFGKIVDRSFDDAIERVIHALQGEGFGVLADIDVAGAMKKKLNQDMPSYGILGACNPPLAHRALGASPRSDCSCRATWSFDRMTWARSTWSSWIQTQCWISLEKPDIKQLAAEVRERLERVMAALS